MKLCDGDGEVEYGYIIGHHHHHHHHIPSTPHIPADYKNEHKNNLRGMQSGHFEH